MLCDDQHVFSLAGPRVPRHVVKHYSGCVCKVFRDEMEIRIGRLMKHIALPSVGGPQPINQLKAQIKG